MKIAHLTTVDMSLRYLVLPQLEAALQLGEVMGISASGEFVAELEARGIRHVPLGSSTRGWNPAADLRSVVELWRVLRAEKVDLLHTHNPKPGVYGRIVGRLAGVPIVVNTVHGLYASDDSPLLKRAIVYGLEWLAARFSDAELVQNEEDLRLLLQLRIASRDKTRLLGNGVDLARFNPDAAAAGRDELRAELGISDEQIVVGMVGRLVAEKGIPELVEAAEQLEEGFVVAVVGPHDPEKSDAVPADLIARGERAGIRFLGMRDDVQALYGAFDVFVLPSHREGFPRAAMEACASGLPVVATDIRGCRQVVDDGINGFLFPVGDVDSLVSRVRDIGTDPEMRVRMGAASAAIAAERFDEQDVVAIVMQTYEDLAGKAGLQWTSRHVPAATSIETATYDDALPIARLHMRMISTGFLSRLGVRFLVLLYRALIADQRSLVLKVESDGVVLGFIAGTEDTSGFYRYFVRHHLLDAVWRVLPSMARPSNLKMVMQTLRHGARDSAVSAELLSMAVAPSAHRMGLGSSLVDGLLEWARSNRLPAMKVVVGADNEAAFHLYRASGFRGGHSKSMHAPGDSWELIWSP